MYIFRFEILQCGDTEKLIKKCSVPGVDPLYYVTGLGLIRIKPVLSGAVDYTWFNPLKSGLNWILP